MTDALRHKALGAIAVLRYTSHQDKAAILCAYFEALKLQSEVALDRAARLQDRGWRFRHKHSSKPMLRLRHRRLFYEVNLRPNGDAEFRLMRVRNSHWISAQDADGFEAYIVSIDRGDQHAVKVAKWLLVGAVMVLVSIFLLRMVNAA